MPRFAKSSDHTQTGDYMTCKSTARWQSQAIRAAQANLLRDIVIATIACALIVGGLAIAIAQKASAHEQHHRGYTDANGNPLSLVGYINYKLRKYVHPTGKCLFGKETLTTYYWQGTRVASGGHFNPHGLSAAHRSLPFGTRLHIVNPHNDRSVDVVVNDRGPYTIANLDLSLGAARVLGLRESSYLCVSGL
jgi:rare lipoprotein A (peptidoglycan hydrolase)